MIKHLFLLLTLAFCVNTSHAQTTADEATQMLRELLARPEVLPQLEERMRKQQNEIDPNCEIKAFYPAGIHKQEVSLSPSVPPVDAYQVALKLLDCNGDILLRQVAFLIRPDLNQAIPVPLVPGESQTSIRLQMDLLKDQRALFESLKEKAGPSLDDCRKLIVTDTRLLSQSTGGRQWREEWDINFCGPVFTQEIIFTATPTGVAYEIR